MEFVTWNQFNKESILEAERKKQNIESMGWTLIHETIGCLTYRKERESV